MSLRRNLALKQHFTDAQPINRLMCRLLGNVEGLTILEPSVGHGAFLAGLQGKPAKIDVVDIDAEALKVVRARFAAPNIELFEVDFVDIFVDGVLGSAHPVRTRRYDGIISNPPYGLYFDIKYRKRIKKLFPDVYSRESYGLFFAFAISRLVDGGRYSFLMPDTFLSSVNHRPLRNLMCSQAAPTHIIRFPSKLFETVNFGYGNLCIVAGNKKPLAATDVVHWIDVFDDQSLDIEAADLAKSVEGSALLCAAEQGWSDRIANCHHDLSAHWSTLGEHAECRTGIYTGDNEQFIGYDAHRVTRRLNGHAINWQEQVNFREMSSDEKLEGIEDEPYYVPLIRGGHREPFEGTAWGIRWDKAAITFYKTDKKARFQNATFYFRQGLSVPMVTSARISAALMNNAVFDQGVVGVFPHDVRIIPALLLYLNSSYASVTMKKLVNGSANNSANYLKRLPVPPLSEANIAEAQEIVERIKLGRLSINIAGDEFATKIGAILPNQVGREIARLAS